MFRVLTVLIVSFLSTNTLAAPVDAFRARRAAQAKLDGLGVGKAYALFLPALTVASADGTPMGHLFSLAPVGFVIVAADDDLSPIIAYSLTDDLPYRDSERQKWLQLIRADLTIRLSQLHVVDAQALDARRDQWQRLTDGGADSVCKMRFEQWPAAGSTSTGGWLEANWHQNAPYNDVCPVDSVTGNRSVAGCPAVAMAQILNYHRTTNDTRFSDGDDYYHSYAGRNYWIDDDHEIHHFASFPELSASLDALQSRYWNGILIKDSDAAALTFACGVAAQQVYTSSVSGTFGVGQAVQAYTRFGVTGIELLGETHPDLYTRMADNMKNALPVHLAVLDSGGGGGHNLVVDGYNTDDYFHLNFGWGGSANGWYLLPHQIPYGLTIIEGAIVDIGFPEFIFADGFESGDLSSWSVVAN